MEKRKNITQFPSGFFTKNRPDITPSKDPDDKIIPIKWSKEVETKQKKAVVKKLKV